VRPITLDSVQVLERTRHWAERLLTDCMIRRGLDGVVPIAVRINTYRACRELLTRIDEVESNLGIALGTYIDTREPLLPKPGRKRRVD